MDTERFFAASRLVIVAGKGGVGKTTVSAALARAAARTGFTTLVVEVEGTSGLSAMFGQGELGYEEAVLAPGGGPGGAADVRARTLTADAALLEYLQDHGLSRVSKRLVSSGALDVVATAAPGIKDILLLGKVKQLVRQQVADLVVLDAPAAGHAITFLQAARSLVDTVSVGPINAQARDVLALLEDHRMCQVLLVTIPEETPVNEAVETAFSLEDRVGVGLGPVVVNGLYPSLEGLAVAPAGVEAAAGAADVALRPGEAEALAAAAAFRLDRSALQVSQVARLEQRLPLPQLGLPFVFTTEIGPLELDQLADALLAGIDDLAELPL
ncbi:MAG TPA: ArsA-related P-loop ATPase [Acidimicrobiales bacterium]|nr:ArsA-related P-loop ATPase [Acidimicrobiales bacterium]